MVAKMKSIGRSPSATIAKQVLKKRSQKLKAKDVASNVEAKFRKAGGYGKGVVSIWAEPKGGIEKSPAYRKMLTRVQLDEKGKPPPPEERDGAPLKGGYPLGKYAPNVIVDGLRCVWLPDDWAQVLKNTGPGGVYHGWLSPEGKFFYHRNYKDVSGVEPHLGRKLSIKDGLNTLKRNLRNVVKPGADKEFLRECLTAAERKHVAPAKEFHFAVVSARRASTESGQHDIMVIEGHFQQVGVKPVWYVDEASLEEYKALGCNAKVGGKLTPARNMALDDAKKKKLVCVQVSDDISRWWYYDCEKQHLGGEDHFKKANQALLGTKKHCVSPLAAAQFILAKMRSDPDKPHLGGVFPTGNAAMSIGGAEFAKEHFILGDFFVAEPASPCRFDNTMTLKEDYDFTCQHLKTHGSVLRCQRMMIQVKHATNAGGAVAARDSAGVKEKQNIAILQKKWPGVFYINGRRKGIADSEVVMSWRRYGTSTPSAKKRGVISKLKKLKTVPKFQTMSKMFPHDAVLRYTRKAAKVAYLDSRCKTCHKLRVEHAIGMKYKDGNGIKKTYGYSDLKYDVGAGRLEVKKNR